MLFFTPRNADIVTGGVFGALAAGAAEGFLEGSPIAKPRVRFPDYGILLLTLALVWAAVP